MMHPWPALSPPPPPPPHRNLAPSSLLPFQTLMSSFLFTTIQRDQSLSILEESPFSFFAPLLATIPFSDAEFSFIVPVFYIGERTRFSGASPFADEYPRATSLVGGEKRGTLCVALLPPSRSYFFRLHLRFSSKDLVFSFSGRASLDVNY